MICSSFKGNYFKYLLFILLLIFASTTNCAFALEQLKAATNQNNWTKVNPYTNRGNTLTFSNDLGMYYNAKNKKADAMVYQSVTTPAASINAYYSIVYQTYRGNRTPSAFNFTYYYGNNTTYNNGTLIVNSSGYDVTNGNTNTTTKVTSEGTITNLNTSATYYFKAYLSVQFGNNSAQSGVKIFSVSCNFSPSNLAAALTATNNIIDGVKLTWNKSTSSAGVTLTNYKVYRSTAENGTYTCIATVTGNPANPSYNDTLESGGTYWYYVTDTGSDGKESPASKKVSITYPAPVTGLTGQLKVDGWNRIQLDWNAVAGYTGQYRTLYGTTSGGPYNTTLWSSSNTVNQNSLTEGTTYYYVTTYDYNGKSVKYSDEASVYVLYPPEGLTAAATYDMASSEHKVNLSWNTKSVTGLQNYKIYRSDTVSGTYSLIGTVPAGTTTFVDDSGLNSGLTYYYKISCVTAKGESALSNSANAYIYKSPENLTGTINGSGNPVLTWRAPGNPNPGGYRLFRSSTSSGPWVEVQNWISGTTYTDTGMTVANGESCYYYVTEINWNYETAPSNIANLTNINAPTNLQAVENSGAVNLTWNSSTTPADKLSGYNIYRSSTPGGPYSKLGNVVGEATTFNDTNILPGDTYYYVVRTCNLSGAESADSNEANCLIPIKIRLNVTDGQESILLNGTNVSNATVNWTITTKAAGVTITGYTVSIVDAGGGIVKSTTAAANVTSCVVPSVFFTSGNYLSRVDVSYTMGAGTVVESFLSDGFSVTVQGTTEVRDGVSGLDISSSYLDNHVEANWDFDPSQNIVKYEVAVGTDPVNGKNNVIDWTDVGWVKCVSLSSPTLASGTRYYTSIRGVTQAGDYAIQGTSDGFVARKDAMVTDTDASSCFNNARVLENLTTSGGRLAPKNLSNAGGGYWKYCMPVTVTEPGITDRVNAPCRIQFTATPAPGNVREYRVTDDQGNELPRYNLSATAGSPNIVFLLNMKKGETKTFYVYWGNASATDPAYGFTMNTDKNCLNGWTPYYTRNDLPAGMEEVTYGTSISTGDDTSGNGTFTDLSRFYFFGTDTRNNWKVITNGNINTAGSTDYSNTLAEFKSRQMIAPLWVDLQVGTALSGSGVYRTVATNPKRIIISWYTYRFGQADDMYEIQAVMYETGDIALRYHFLSARALNLSGSYDKPVNVTEHTVGISNGDNSKWLTNTPLVVGNNKSPTAFYQCMDAFMGNISYGTVKTTGEAAHFESMVFDTRIATPKWLKLIYDVTINGGSIELAYRTGNSELPDGSWSAWAGVTDVTATNAAGEIDISAASGRYIQYRAVFKKTAAANTQYLNEVRFLFGGISIEDVYSELSPGVRRTEVSQGEQNIPVTVSVKNLCNESLSLQSVDLNFTLIGHSYSLREPTLPITLTMGETATLTYFVSVTDTAPTGECTIDAEAEASGSISDDSAQRPFTWTVKSRSELVIDRVFSDRTEVTKGQTVTMDVTISNVGEADCLFDFASLNRVVGKYTFTLASPATGTTVIPGGGSITARFAVVVATDSDSGKDTLNATASATNKLSGEKIEVLSSENPHIWTVQNPAELVLKEVVASSTVYRGQKNNSVVLWAQNQGEAELEWNAIDSILRFDPHIGSYENIRKVVGDDIINLVGNQLANCIFMVDITADTATGTDIIDGDIYGTELNRNEPLEYLSGAVIPGLWTIYAEKMNTYSDGSYRTECNSFNAPTGANTKTVFAKVENLAAGVEYVIHWFDPNGTEIQTSVALTADSAANIYSSYVITSSSMSGTYKVTASNPLGTVTCCQNDFEVVVPASMVATFTLPTTATVGQDFVASFTFINEGGAAIESATLGGTVTKIGAGTATLIPPAAGREFDPQYSDVPGHGQATATYRYTATGAGAFQLRNRASGYDANSHDVLQTADITSNVCTIQTPPDIAITLNALPATNIYLNQKNLTVTATIKNNGQATAIIDAASITANIGTYEQRLDGLTLPFELSSGQTKTLTFDVGVDVYSATGLDTLVVKAIWYDKNWPESGNKVSTSGSRTWTIQSIGIRLASDADFNYEQSDFCRNQTVNIKVYGIDPNSTYYRIRIYNTQKAFDYNATTNTTSQMQVSPLLAADSHGEVDYLYTLSNTATIGVWTVLIEFSGTTGGSNPGTLRCLQYFNVQNPPSLTATLEIDDSKEIFVGDRFNVALTVRSTAANSAAVDNIAPYSLVKAAGATGNATLVSGPDPATFTLYANESRTFEYVFEATANTGDASSAANRYKLTSSDASYAVMGKNRNNVIPMEVTANKVNSNGIVIYSKEIGVTPLVDFGTMICGQSVLNGTFTVFKLGNYPAKNIRLSAADFNGEVDPDTGVRKRISKAYFFFEPECITTLNSDTTVSAHLDIPYNQSSGDYETTMFVYSDENNNGVYDNGETLAEFRCVVRVEECSLLNVSNNVEMGGWPKGANGVETTHFDVTFFGSGNTDLSNVKVKMPPIATATFNFYVSEQNIGAVGMGESHTIQVWADTRKINPEPIPNTYIATFTIFEDKNDDGIIQDTEPYVNFYARISIGRIEFVVTPGEIQAIGVNPSTTATTGDFPYFNNLTIRNTGELDLSRVKLSMEDLKDSNGHTIDASNVILDYSTLTSPLQPGQTDDFSISVFVPAGSRCATYTTDLYVYNDDNQNGVMDSTEYRQMTKLVVYVLPTYKLQVTNHMVNMGGAQSGIHETVKIQSFECRNTGNIAIEDLKFIANDFVHETISGNVIPKARVEFPDDLCPDKVESGDFFSPTISLTIPANTDDGRYISLTMTIYNDHNHNNVLDADEAQDTFQCMIDIGNLRFILDKTELNVNGSPNEPSTQDVMAMTNNGTLDVSNLVATSTELTGPGGEIIPANACVFNPTNAGTIIKNQSKTMKWGVDIPPAVAMGTYTCTITVWGDSNGDGKIDEGEPQKTITGNLYVRLKPSIDVLADTYEMADSLCTGNPPVEGCVEIANSGNMPVSNITYVLEPLKLGGSAIATSYITCDISAPNIAVGSSVTATYTISMPTETIGTGRYSGVQTIYADLNGNGTCDPDEPKDTFTLIVTIGEKHMTLTPSPLDFGDVNTGSVYTKELSVKNDGGARLRKVLGERVAPCACGCSDAELTCDKAARQTAINVNATEKYTFNLAIGSTKAGQHVEQWRFYDGNYSVDLEIRYRIAERIELEVSPDPIVKTIKKSKTESFNISVKNTGNVEIDRSKCLLNFTDLTNSRMELFDSSNFNIVSVSGSLGIDETAVFSVTCTVEDEQATGTFRGVGYISVDGVQYDTFEIAITVPDTSTANVPGDTVHQVIASSTFETDPVLLSGGSVNYFLSAWVCAGAQDDEQSFANLSIVRYDGDSGEPKTSRTIRLDNKTLNVDVVSSHTALFESFPNTGTSTAGLDWIFYDGDPNKPVYGASGQAVPAERDGTSGKQLLFKRVYFGFTIDGIVPEAGHATDTIRILLTNSSPDNGVASTTVYFDGIKLEKMILQDQDKPTTYHDGTTLFSPSHSLDMSGNHQYYEW